MNKDIENFEDIQVLIDSFYRRVRQDDVIGYLFNDVAKLDWEKHLPVMYQFWQQIIFQTGAYHGNPMLVHQQLHQQSALTKEHFDRWQKLFTETVDEHFCGFNASTAKQRAVSIAGVMQRKLLHKGLL